MHGVGMVSGRLLHLVALLYQCANTHRMLFHLRCRTLLTYVWPQGQPELRARVVAAMALLLGGKAVGVAVPFAFKSIADTLSLTSVVTHADTVADMGVIASIDPSRVALMIPMTALLGCK